MRRTLNFVGTEALLLDIIHFDFLIALTVDISTGLHVYNLFLCITPVIHQVLQAKITHFYFIIIGLMCQYKHTCSIKIHINTIHRQNSVWTMHGQVN
jgi:hypothetical protein